MAVGVIGLWLLEWFVAVGVVCGCWSSLWLLEWFVAVGVVCGCWSGLWLLV